MTDPYWKMIWRQFLKHPLGMLGLFVVILFTLAGIYAPFLASSKPIAVLYHGEWYFPLFRYLFYAGFFTKKLDIFFNLLIFTIPCMILALVYGRKHRLWIFLFFVLVQIAAFAYLIYKPLKDPAPSGKLHLNWQKELDSLSPYAKLNLILRYWERKQQQIAFEPYEAAYKALTKKTLMPTLWNWDRYNEKKNLERLEKTPGGEKEANYIIDRNAWLEEQSNQFTFILMPFISHFHWEDDAGGDQNLNKVVGWLELTRINRKDLTAALIFGVRISLVVGITAIALALLIGIPIGSLAGFYGGNLDILISRLLEIWESMPIFFMLLIIVAITQSKSIFLIVAVIGIFGWTSFSRFIRGEFFKQRNLSYVEACRAQGFSNRYIMFKHILPNAIPPILTLLPFAIMGAITSEAALSFLGLGEEGSCSWGVLMDEGRSAFPGESYLLWPPALLLTILLVAIALVGDSLRDALDPKLHRIGAK